MALDAARQEDHACSMTCASAQGSEPIDAQRHATSSDVAKGHTHCTPPCRGSAQTGRPRRSWSTDRSPPPHTILADDFATVQIESIARNRPRRKSLYAAISGDLRRTRGGNRARQAYPSNALDPRRRLGSGVANPGLARSDLAWTEDLNRLVHFVEEHLEAPGLRVHLKLPPASLARAHIDDSTTRPCRSPAGRQRKHRP